MKSVLIKAGLAAVLAVGASYASAGTVNSLAPSGTLGAWTENSSNGGSGEIVDLTGLGGDLENNAPAGSGALKLQTNSNGSAKSEVKYEGNFGTIGDFLQNGMMSFDYYHNSGAPNANIAPALKFELYDATDINGDGYATFIYEPIYNGGVTFNSWQSVSIGPNTGNFWHTGMYGVSGIDYDETIFDWATLLSTMSDAVIGSIIFGIGSGTPDQLGYVDDFYFKNGDLEVWADFEVSVVPLPATLPLYAAGMFVLGLLGWRKRK